MDKVKKGPDSPLRVGVERGELVIRVGINRLDGSNGHPVLPPITFTDREQWVKDVIAELVRTDDAGSDLLTSMLEDAIGEALDNGSGGVAGNSPTHVGSCDFCGRTRCGILHVTHGLACVKCFDGKRHVKKRE